MCWPKGEVVANQQIYHRQNNEKEAAQKSSRVPTQ
jgi:hypothetical protein